MEIHGFCVNYSFWLTIWNTKYQNKDQTLNKIMGTSIKYVAAYTINFMQFEGREGTK